MRHSPFLVLLFGAALLVAVPYTLIHASETHSLASAMNPNVPADFNHHVIKVAGRDFLTSRVLLDPGYTVTDLPKDEVDLSNPARSQPLLVAIKPTGSCVFAVSARPSYSDGTASQWLQYMITEEGYEHDPIQRTQIGASPAVTCDARQTGDGVVMHMRFVLLEDGGRVFVLNAMAPAEFWPATEERLMTMLRSFELQSARGTTVALFPGEEPPVLPTASAPAAPGGLTAAVATNAASAPSSGLPSARLSPQEFAELVLASEPTSLDQDVGMNADFRDRGVGLVPRVVSTDPEEKSARLGAAAIEGIFRVPFGWYATDDGRRTLVFDDDGRVQISLNLRRHEGGSLQDYARSLVAPYLEREPELPVAVLEFDDGIAGAGVRGANIEGEVLDQVFLVRPAGPPGHVLVARVTAAEGDSVRALNLAGDILARLETARELVAQN